MKSFAAVAVTAVSLAVLPGCIIVATDRHYHPATKEELAAVRQLEPGQARPTVRSECADELSKLSPGASVEQFKAAFPKAVFVEQRSEGGHTVDAYSVKSDVAYHFRGDDYIQTSRDEAWFYFKDGAFVKWGEPHEWP